MKRRASNAIHSPRAGAIGAAVSLDDLPAELGDIEDGGSIFQTPTEDSPTRSKRDHTGDGTKLSTATKSRDNKIGPATADLLTESLHASNAATPAEIAESEYICYGMVSI